MSCRTNLKCVEFSGLQLFVSQANLGSVFSELWQTDRWIGLVKGVLADELNNQKIHFFGPCLLSRICTCENKAADEFVELLSHILCNVILSSVHTTPEEFEKVALFLRLRPTFHTNLSGKRSFSSQRNLKTSALRFSVDGKRFENRDFRKRWRYDNHVIFLTELSSNTQNDRPRFQISPAYCGQTTIDAFSECVLCFQISQA